MHNDSVRVRFAPSPTGDFHVGGARTALFNYVFARRHQGSFILRIEDTDRKRFNPDALDWLLNGLRYLGMEWDEGPEVGGEYGPYIQSQRHEIYHEKIAILLKHDKAYACFCTSERLEALRDDQKRRKQDIGYDGHCRRLSLAEAERRIEAGEYHVIRAKLPENGTVMIQDEIRGEITFDYGRMQDAVLLKADGTPTYHFANVVDDHLMAITHILRGDEWVNSLPLHHFLYSAFGWDPPLFVHLPVILNPTGKGKMSKRAQRAPDGSEYPVFVRQFQEAGYLPEALVNFLALLGWSYDDHTEFMTIDEIIRRFSLERISPSPAAFDYEKLRAMNGHYIRSLSMDDLARRIIPFLEKAGLPADQQKVEALLPLVQERMFTLAESAGQLDIFLQEKLAPYDPAILLPKRTGPEDTVAVLEKVSSVLQGVQFDEENIEGALRRLVEDMGLKAGVVFQPIRCAVCGRKNAPPLFATLAAMGREKVLQRLAAAITLLTEWNDN